MEFRRRGQGMLGMPVMRYTRGGRGRFRSGGQLMAHTPDLIQGPGGFEKD